MFWSKLLSLDIMNGREIDFKPSYSLFPFYTISNKFANSFFQVIWETFTILSWLFFLRFVLLPFRFEGG